MNPLKKTREESSSFMHMSWKSHLKFAFHILVFLDLFYFIVLILCQNWTASGPECFGHRYLPDFF